MPGTATRSAAGAGAFFTFFTTLCMQFGKNKHRQILPSEICDAYNINAVHERRSSQSRGSGQGLSRKGMNDMNTEENEKKTEEEDPRPLTDKEFEELKKKEKRTSGIISAVVDFVTGFFQ